MKKIIALSLSMLMIMGLAACGNTSDQTGQPSTENGSVENDITNDMENAEPVEAQPEETQPEETQPEGTQPEGMQPEETEVPEESGSQILVAYFSATNTTEGVAEQIADSLSADLYEIMPEQPYTDADLDYHDDNSRSTIEMNDPSARPAISGSVENMEQYTVVFLGYPIWWGEAPRIIDTFVESYDFSGKTIVPFCTSGGSGIGSSATNLEALADGAAWLSGTRLNGGSSRETIVEWINGLGLDITAE